MIRSALLASALLLPMAALAQSTNTVGGWHNNQPLTQTNSPNSPSARANAFTASAATTGASTASAGGASVSYSDRLQAPGLASYAAPSGPCVGVSTFATGSVAGFGIGGGRSEIEDECQVREAARLLHAMGATGEALALIRNLPSVRRSMPQAPTVSVVAAPPPAAAVTLPMPAVLPPTARPDWCDTASGPERRRVGYIRECVQ